MSIIDVREAQNGEVTTLVFADPTDDDERAVAHKVVADSRIHPNHLFIEDRSSEYMPIRRSDVPYLIKALQAAQDLWEGCK